MKYWKAHFKDQFHNEEITIINNEEGNNSLSFELDGIKFSGNCPHDFSLEDENQCEEAMKKFRFIRHGGYNEMLDMNSPYCYDLQRYSLNVEIPLTLLRKKDNFRIEGTIHIAFSMKEYDSNIPKCRYSCDNEFVYGDDIIVHNFYICVDNERFDSDKQTLYFETALNDISEKMKEKYCIMSCFTCQYSEYSPYGNDDFGMMLCYKDYKEECIKVNSKDDYFELLENKNFDIRQETYLCSEYEPRIHSSGYRGFVNGVK